MDDPNTSRDRAGASTTKPSKGQVRVLVVDDEGDVRDVVSETLALDARIIVVGRAHDGREAIQLVDELDPDVVMMDVNMPRLDGCQATEQIARAHPDVRVVALTGTADPDAVTRMIVAGAVSYAVKGSDPSRLADIVVDAVCDTHYVDTSALDGLFRSVVRLARDERRRRNEAERLADELARAYRETVASLSAALRSRDGETDSHGDRVATRVVEVAKRLGLSGQRLVDVEYAALFHDIGKIAMPDAILYNTDDLTESEWRVVREHTVVGERIISPVGFLRGVSVIVRHSHEHWDGSGYPDGLVGDEIPVESRIVFACDAYDAMTSSRTYQDQMTPAQAVARLRELSGVHFDPQIVDILCELVEAEQRADAGAAARR